MKKIFLLSLLSVLLLSAFSQSHGSNSEILSKIYFSASMDDDEATQAFERGIWILFYRTVITEVLPDGGIRVTCNGWGLRTCLPHKKNLQRAFSQLSIGVDQIEQILEELIKESNDLVNRGEYRGSISKKIAVSNSQVGGRDYYLLFLMNWNNDPKKPYNGEAEIIISKTTNFGLF